MIYLRPNLLRIKKQALEEIVALKFETSGNSVVCSKFITTNTEFSSLLNSSLGWRNNFFQIGLRLFGNTQYARCELLGADGCCS